VFRNQDDFMQIKRTLLRFLPAIDLTIRHHALMHTHFHLLAWAGRTTLLAGAMKAALLSYEHYYRRKYGHRGHLWHSRYRSIIIKTDGQYLQCARYVELNPVYAGICRLPEGYRWTSYRYYADGLPDPLVSPDADLLKTEGWTAGEANASYRKFVLAGIDLDYQQEKKRFEREVFEKYGPKVVHSKNFKVPSK